ncbi:MAG: AAA family ATPase, partial [Candidatus Nanopelagicaceae bacterium]
IKKTFDDIVRTGDVPNMILSGGAGCGKTTVAKAMCAELGLDCMFINASEDGGIDTLRTKIRNFASTVSLNGGKKVVILDEADYLNPQSTQPALRGFIEEFAANCRFVMTYNFKSRIIDPLHSRCSVIDFKIPTKEKPEMAKGFLERVKMILDTEEIKYDEKVLAALIVKHFPDFRRVLNIVQRYAASGGIDTGILASSDIAVSSLIESMKKKDFAGIRKWAAENSDKDISAVYRSIYEGVSSALTPAALAQAIIIIAEYQYKAAFVADQEINLVACCLVLASDCAFT